MPHTPPIAAFHLPSEARVYGSPVNLTAETEESSSGKMVYSEWPLAQDLEHVSDLAQLAREKDRLKGLLEEGQIGKVLSVEVRAVGGTNDREILLTSLEYFTKRAVGGNIFTISVGPNSIVHGDADAVQSRLQLQFPIAKLRDPSTNIIIKNVTSDVPDLIVVTSPSPPQRS
ncbi:hypothetical protein B0H14DRAFT_3530136 [Mycena olivaceomarginata]|nr:hypothetical protein B0H14DRAFT_3530136 [Mycena olivaceomarginata]